MAHVIIVSNRLPISVTKEKGKLVFSESIGGLATGLSSYANDPNNSWIGWPGIASDELSEAEKQDIAAELTKRNCYPVFLRQKQIDDFYNGYSNSVLWPLFHDLAASHIKPERLSTMWQAYRKVNEQFASTVINLAQPGSRIWVHDYQLMLLPQLLRSEQSVTSIGFFLHIPFPTLKSWSRLKENKKLLSGVLGADLVGFHTTGYVTNFLNACKGIKEATVGHDRIDLPTHAVQVSKFPMGIDYKKYADAGKTKAVKRATKRNKKLYGRRKLIVSVDRLDPTKGLLNRLQAYQEFLVRNPRWHGKVVFAMVAAPSRTDLGVYQRLGVQLQKLADEINHTYGTKQWQPLDYIPVSKPFEEVAALFRAADIAFITPIRDGMNLAAKEFVASNRRRGILILSETAGAAEELPDALIVNPNSMESLVGALQAALVMKKKELRGRLKHMKKDLSVHTVQQWAQSFVDTLQQPLLQASHMTRTVNTRLTTELHTAYGQANKRLILLDYDGTLVPFSGNYHDQKPPASVMKLLEKLSADPANTVVLTSGRSADDLQAWFHTLPINLVAEHGAAIKKYNNKTWQIREAPTADWKMLLIPILDTYTAEVPGARLEIKQHSLVWHYRLASPYLAQKYAVIIRKALKPLLKRYDLELMQGNKILEIKNPNISKASSAERWLKHEYPFVLFVGDDQTDEALFEALPKEHYTIKVGRGRTAAQLRVASSKEVLALLRKLSS